MKPHNQSSSLKIHVIKKSKFSSNLLNLLNYNAFKYLKNIKTLHPHIIGVPHIAYYFEQALELLMKRDDTIFVTSSTMGDWFIKADGTNGANVAPYNDGPPQ